MKFSEDKYREVMHITVSDEYCMRPIDVSMASLEYYDKPVRLEFSIAEAEKLVGCLLRAVDKARLLVKKEEGEADE